MKDAEKSSRYEANLLRQPALVQAVLQAPRPAWMRPPKGRRTFLVGIGTNHHAARIAAWLWRDAGLDAWAWHSFDFVLQPPHMRRSDLGVFLSHKGGRSLTTQAEALAHRARIQTAVLTGEGGAWPSARKRVETGPQEDTQAFTQSFSTAMAWLLRWAGRPWLLTPFQFMDSSLRWGPPFPKVGPTSDIVILGDGPREWVAREIALKIQETSALRARAFGLEEFLHGPHVSVGRGSVAIGLSVHRQPRWRAARRCLKSSGAVFVEARSENWLAQTLWGQRFALEICRRLGIDPDRSRPNDPRRRRLRDLIQSRRSAG